MKTRKISIIMPVYNAEKTLERCVDSVLGQSFQDFELILVDDGSKDGSATICDEYAEKDSRVKVFHKENGGVSSARNRGLDEAWGEWVMFVDSDDYLLEDALRECDLKDGIQYAVFGFREQRRNEPEINHSLRDLTLTPAGFVKEYVGTASFNSPFSKIYKRNVIGDLRFDSSIRFGEDCIFNFEYLRRVDKVRTVDRIIYHYDAGDYSQYPTKYKLKPEEIALYFSRLFPLYDSFEVSNSWFECGTLSYNEWMAWPAIERNSREWFGNPEVRKLYKRVDKYYTEPMMLECWLGRWLPALKVYRNHVKPFVMRNGSRVKKLIKKLCR